ncbi:MAG: hypothetical protein WC972_13955, partial [Trueperaceae bacterium]
MTETTKIQLRPGERFKKAIEHPATMWVALLLLGAVLFIVAEVKGVSGTQLLSLLVRGTLLGGTLALGAVGVTLVYGVLKMANFAHGDTMTLGAYLGLIVITLLPKGPVLKPFSFGYEFLVGLVIVIPLVGLVAFGLDRIAFRPLRARRSQPIMFAMAALGLAFGIRSLIYIFWGADFSFYYTGRPRPAFEL